MQKRRCADREEKRMSDAVLLLQTAQSGAPYQQRRMRTEREAHWNRVDEALQEPAARNYYRMLYRIMRQWTGKTKTTDEDIRKGDGAFVQ
ncbi:hypothetical protein Aduo_004691 [Ancylostoma duodenale]